MPKLPCRPYSEVETSKRVRKYKDGSIESESSATSTVKDCLPKPTPKSTPTPKPTTETSRKEIVRHDLSDNGATENDSEFYQMRAWQTDDGSSGSAEAHLEGLQALNWVSNESLIIETLDGFDGLA